MREMVGFCECSAFSTTTKTVPNNRSSIIEVLQPISWGSLAKRFTIQDLHSCIILEPAGTRWNLFFLWPRSLWRATCCLKNSNSISGSWVSLPPPRGMRCSSSPGCRLPFLPLAASLLSTQIWRVYVPFKTRAVDFEQVMTVRQKCWRRPSRPLTSWVASSHPRTLNL